MRHEAHPVLLFVACAIVVPAVLAVGGPGCGGQWQEQPFEHEWPLVGRHEPLGCDACHPATEPIGELPAACEACHEPDRPEAHYVGQGCGDCHTPFGWDDLVGAVDHSFFPLVHSHELDCLSCHEADTFEGLDTACTSCHAPDRPIEHYPGECSDCHVPTYWLEASEVDHGWFPLADAHAVGCIDCHADGVFEGRSSSCGSCHEDDRPAAHHSGEDCGGCHTPTAWSDAVVDHDFLPLTDAHDLGCESCHTTPGDYTGLDATCGTCHAGDTPAGDHNRGEDCAFCHLATTWGEVTFDHADEFPIPHRGADTCVDCHLSQPDYTSMSCLDGCHSRGDTDDRHGGVSSYSYTSAACYDCHADGQVP